MVWRSRKPWTTRGLIVFAIVVFCTTLAGGRLRLALADDFGWGNLSSSVVMVVLVVVVGLVVMSLLERWIPGLVREKHDR